MPKPLLSLLYAIKTRCEEYSVLAEGSLAYEVIITGKKLPIIILI